MHSNRIIHRDLKPANILSHNGVYKIADLGFSKQITETTNTILGSITTMAPEVMLRQPYGIKVMSVQLRLTFGQSGLSSSIWCLESCPTIRRVPTECTTR